MYGFSVLNLGTFVIGGGGAVITKGIFIFHLFCVFSPSLVCNSAPSGWPNTIVFISHFPSYTLSCGSVQQIPVCCNQLTGRIYDQNGTIVWPYESWLHSIRADNWRKWDFQLLSRNEGETCKKRLGIKRRLTGAKLRVRTRRKWCVVEKERWRPLRNGRRCVRAN